MENVTKLNEAFQNFTLASKSLESYYEKLNTRVQHLTGELGRKNQQLKEAILKVGETKDYLQSVLQSIGEAIIVLDQNNKVTMINRAAEDMLCISSAGSRGRFFEDLDFTISSSSSGSIVDVQGRRYDVIISSSRLSDRGQVILIKNISRLKELERQEERNLRLISMGEMAAKIVHEIRSPLCSIELYSTMMSKDLEKTPHAEMARGISTGIKSLNNILTNMLFFAKPQKPLFKYISLKGAVDDTVSMLRPLIDARGVRLSMELEDEMVSGDPELLKQVIMNIILNAVQAMSDGGHLEINLKRNGEYAVLGVSDEGEGIDLENMEKIFDPFFSTKEKGTGLGLAITHKIIKSHDGHIQVDNNKDRGATFRICLPSKKEEYVKDTEETLCMKNG